MKLIGKGGQRLNSFPGPEMHDARAGDVMYIARAGNVSVTGPVPEPEKINIFRRHIGRGLGRVTIGR